jgi:hypothetical protein
MIKHGIAILVIALAASGLLVAQAPARLSGTVTAITTDVLTIKDKDGKSTMIMLDKATKYIKEKKAVTTADVKVGALVTVDAKMDTVMKMYTAQQVDVATAVTLPDGKK